jgi:hypothetical protein
MAQRATIDSVLLQEFFLKFAHLDLTRQGASATW